ncbi:NAD(P)-dependent alcohol dehydrogenase [Asticcacaulis sp. DXS10W]|uniref:NAD(P)-dependent alcohol dehydrogenase n=1 Tax=Asticcacaulis currens TaxID=2984210 RepID=A0ABT5IDK9_9CAUL|nr:NAD(P)-dependent alcohol dehydrogenase [Asticcacaulis currens]MDC7694265.1 NAD(P)-dependent alcohol dehydrogenase [Asticcacaulis currens]
MIDTFDQSFLRHLTSVSEPFVKALLLTGPSPDLVKPVSLPDPEKPGRGEVLVRMKAASVNFIDTAVASGLYPGISYPIVPVADGAGVVIGIGEGVTGVKVGHRVAIHPKSRWIAGRPTAERARTMRGVTHNGSLQEFATVPSDTVVVAPGFLDWRHIAALPIAATTAWNALKAAVIRPGSWVVLLGTGGLSLMGLQFAKALGAHVIVTSTSEKKAERVKALGADHVIKTSAGSDWSCQVLDLTDGVGADLVLETIGEATFNSAVRSVRQGGTVFTAGFVSGSRVEVDLMSIITRAVRVIGVNTGSVEDLEEAMAVIASADIRPVLGTELNVAAAADALRGQPGFGKTIIHLDW